MPNLTTVFLPDSFDDVQERSINSGFLYYPLYLDVPSILTDILDSELLIVLSLVRYECNIAEYVLLIFCFALISCFVVDLKLWN